MSLASTFVQLGGRPEDVERYTDPKDIGELAEPLRSRIWTVVQDAPNHGLVLVSGRRSPWQQYLLRAERVGQARAFDRDYPGNPRTAIPYSSHHQTGTAADMGGTALSWLVANERRYGLARTVSSERWHFEASGTPTTRILPYGGPTEQEFTVDSEAKAAFANVNAKLDKAIQGLLLLTSRVEELERIRFKPTTIRCRELVEHAGIDSEA